MSKLGFFSDPHVQYVSQVIEEILSGNLQIPRFQRPYIWDWDRRLDLLRSVQLGIPMGSIMIWRTSIETLTTFDSFGTVRFKEPKIAGPRQYLLDGVQRLSTLVSALTPPRGELDEVGSDSRYFVEEADRSAFFDLEANDFVSIKTNQASSRHMPLYVLSNGVELLRFQRGLVGPHADKWISVSDFLSKAFREYKIPVIPIVTDDISLASQTFQRINSAGKQMSEKHMLHALTFSTSFDFTSALDQFRESLDEIGWSGIDDDLMLRLLKVSMQLDMYKANVDDVSISIRSQPSLFRELKQDVTKAAIFFREKMSMPSPDFVPYAVQVIGVVEAFRIARREGISAPEAGLADWVWLTTYLEYFTGLSGDKVTRQINFIRLSVVKGRIDLSQSGLPALNLITGKQRFDYRSARSRAWMVLLANIADDEIAGVGSAAIRTFGRAAVVPGIPREKFQNPELYFSAGNRFLISPNEIDKFRSDLSMRNDDFLKLHGIGDEIAFLLQDNGDAFVTERADRLLELELMRVEHMWGDLEPDTAHAELVRERLIDEITDSGSALRDAVRDAIVGHMENAEWEVDDINSSNGQRVEGEVYEVVLNDYDLDFERDEIAEDKDEPGVWNGYLTASVKATLSVDVTFFHWDSIDREEIEIGKQPIYVDVVKPLTIFLSSKGITEENPSAEWDLDINVTGESYEVAVGEVALDLDD